MKRFGLSLLKILITYVAGVMIGAIGLLTLAMFGTGGISSGDLGLAVIIIAVFSIPVFLLIGLPYLAFAFPTWGREHPLLFFGIAVALGGLGAMAFGSIYTMPEAFPWPLSIVGAFDGGLSAVVWSYLSKRISTFPDA